jgi:hypothetical protein
MKNDNGYGDALGALFIILFIFAVVACIVGGLIGGLCPFWTQEQVNITITEKIPYHDGQYLIDATVNGKDEVFTVSDQYVFLIFDASDRYAELKENHSYNVQTCGYRFQLFSWYKNIYHLNNEIPNPT